MPEIAPSVDLRGQTGPRVSRPRSTNVRRADVHIRVPADLLARLDARLSLRHLRPTRTAAILDAMTRWCDWDERQETSLKGRPRPTQTKPARPEPGEPTYHPLENIP
jgi:hypothetical protein